jgi:hypothetical protein
MLPGSDGPKYKYRERQGDCRYPKQCPFWYVPEDAILDRKCEHTHATLHRSTLLEAVCEDGVGNGSGLPLLAVPDLGG